VSRQVITIWSKQCHDFTLTLTWREITAICTAGSKAHTIKHELLALKQTIKLGLQFRFTCLVGRESVSNRLKSVCVAVLIVGTVCIRYV